MKVENPNIVGISANLVLNRDYSVYPNPTSGILNVKLTRDELTTIKVYTPTGKEVYNVDTQNSVSINTSQWAKGIYMVMLITATSNGITKIIVQ
jgi:hypothetical protein